jgi:hypothetical protein
MRDDDGFEGGRITLTKKALSTIVGRISRDVEVRIQIDPRHPSGFVDPIFLVVLNNAKSVNPDVAYPKL